jgi:ABC-2 type transport system ATP-binding protein
MPEAEAPIRLRGLSKSFGEVRAVDGLDLEVKPGEVFGFLGPNGAGKSTTIRMLLDLLRPTSGDVRILGQDSRAAGPELRRRIGYMPGEFVIYDRQSVDDALTGLAGLRGGVPRRNIIDLANRLDLNLRRTVRELSKGNRQKVGLVQAFMHEPELLILDEPTEGLDPLLRREFGEMLQDVRASGRTVFLSSHVLSEVQETADRVGMIRAGRLIAVDSVETLRTRAVRSVEIHFNEPVSAADFSSVAHLTDVTVADSVLRAHLAGDADDLVKAAARFSVHTLLVEEPDLEDVFLALYRVDAHAGG